MQAPYRGDSLHDVDANDFAWPVAPSEVAQHRIVLEENLRSVVVATGSELLRTTVFIVFKWLMVEYVSLLQASMLAARGAPRESPFGLGDYPMLAGLVDRGVPYGDGVAPLRLRRDAGAGILSSAVNLARRVKRQAEWAGARGVTSHSQSGSGVVTVIAPNPFLVEVLRASGRTPYYLTPAALARAIGRCGDDATEEQARLSDAVADVPLASIDAAGWPVSAGLRDYVRLITRRLFVQAAHDYAALERTWRHRGPSEVWSGSGGNYWVRVARAASRHGAHLTGFQHGSQTAVFRSTDLYYQEGLFAHRFVTYTRAGAELYRENARLWPFGLPPLELTAHPAGARSHLCQLVESQQVRRTTRKVRTVMYVTTVFRGEKQSPELTLLDDAVYLDWQRRLIKTLADAGFTVVCKPHPEGALSGRRHAYASECEFRHRPMEQVWDDVDAFIFDYSATTALWHAMCTQKPVIWVDHGLHPWHAEPYAAVQTRCRVIPARFDDRQRLQVNEAQLIAALTEPQEPVDHAFVRRYLCDPADAHSTTAGGGE
jgi:hypothetical protein